MKISVVFDFEKRTLIFSLSHLRLKFLEKPRIFFLNIRNGSSFNLSMNFITMKKIELFKEINYVVTFLKRKFSDKF